MKLTRREAIEIAAGAAGLAVAAQTLGAQTTSPVPLHWLGGEAPSLASGVSWGVPFRRGEISKTQSFTLTTQSGKSLPLQQWPLAYWPDESMKFVGFSTVAPAGEGGDLRLQPGTAAAMAAPLKLSQSADAVDVDTGVMHCSIPKHGAEFIGSVKLGDLEVARGGRLVCVLEDGSEFSSDVRSVTVEQTGPVRAVVKIEGV